MNRQQYILYRIYQKFRPGIAQHIQETSADQKQAETIHAIDLLEEEINKSQSKFNNYLSIPWTALTPGLRNDAAKKFQVSVIEFRNKLFELFDELINKYECYKLNHPNLVILTSSLKELNKFFERSGLNDKTKKAVDYTFLDETLCKAFNACCALENEKAAVKQAIKAELATDKSESKSFNPIKALANIKDHPTVVKVVTLHSILENLEPKIMQLRLKHKFKPAEDSKEEPKKYTELQLFTLEFQKNYSKLQAAAITSGQDSEAFKAACQVCNKNVVRMVQILLSVIDEILYAVTEYYAVDVSDHEITRAIKDNDRYFLAVHADAHEVFQLKHRLNDLHKRAKILLNDKFTVEMLFAKEDERISFSDFIKKQKADRVVEIAVLSEEKSSASEKLPPEKQNLLNDTFARMINLFAKAYMIVVDQVIAKINTHAVMLKAVTSPSSEVEKMSQETLETFKRDPAMLAMAYKAAERQDSSESMCKHLRALLTHKQPDYNAITSYLLGMSPKKQADLIKKLCQDFPNHKDPIIQAIDNKRIKFLLFFLKQAVAKKQAKEHKASDECDTELRKLNYDFVAAYLICLPPEEKERLVNQLKVHLKQEIIDEINKAAANIERTHKAISKILNRQIPYNDRYPEIAKKVNIKIAAEQLLLLTPEAQKYIFVEKIRPKLKPEEEAVFLQAIYEQVLEAKKTDIRSHWYCWDNEEPDYASAAKLMAQIPPETQKDLWETLQFRGQVYVAGQTAAIQRLNQFHTAAVEKIKGFLLEEKGKANSQGAAEELSRLSPQDQLQVWRKLKHSLSSTQTTELLTVMRDKKLVGFELPSELSNPQSSALQCRR